MDSHRLKIKLGPHEFEAEGTAEVVQEQFEAFKNLVATLPMPSPSYSPSPSASPSPAASVDDIVDEMLDPTTIDSSLTKIMKVEDRIVSLTVQTDTADKAILLLLYGQKIFRKSDAVTGNEIMLGLKATGQKVSRVDRLLDKASDAGNTLIIGARRAKRYRLTNKGLTRARECANEMLEIVA